VATPLRQQTAAVMQKVAVADIRYY